MFQAGSECVDLESCCCHRLLALVPAARGRHLQRGQRALRLCRRHYRGTAPGRLRLRALQLAPLQREAADQGYDFCENCRRVHAIPLVDGAHPIRGFCTLEPAVSALPECMAAAPAGRMTVVLRSWRLWPNHRDCKGAPLSERFLPETWPAALAGFLFPNSLFNAALRVVLAAMRLTGCDQPTARASLGDQESWF